MRYTAQYIQRLRSEAYRRFENLTEALDVGTNRGDDRVDVDGMRVRLAVDDFKTILTEIRKLK